MKSKGIHVSQEVLSELLEYREDGALLWKVSRGGRHPGDMAGTKDPHGYTLVSVNGQRYLAHRIIFYMLTGQWPEIVDHINGDPTDNRIENLRASSHRLNKANSKIRTDNALGIKGVSPMSNGTFKAICDGKYLGLFKTIEDAHAAYKRIAKEAFGDFARFE